MAENPFDQFDAAPSAPVRSTPQKRPANPFDQFDKAKPQAAARPKPAPVQAAPQRKRNILEEVAGAAANITREVPFLDEVGAGMSVALDAATGKVRSLDDVGDSWKRNRGYQQAYEQDFSGRRPLAAAAVRGTTNAATAVVPFAPTANLLASSSRAVNAGRGAVTAAATGATYALGDKGTAQERIEAASRAVRNPLLLASGATGGALAPAAVRAPKVKPQTPQRTLRDAGVNLTPGQSMGGIAKSTEDIAARAPILGPAIRGARKRGVESLNRAVANRSLEPLGEVVPTNIKTGAESVKYVADRLGQVYDDAADMVPQVSLDDDFETALTQLNASAQELGPDVTAQFDRILNNRVLSRLSDGPVSGRTLREIQSQVDQRAANLGSSSDSAQRELGDILEGVSDELKAVLGRANPEAGALINTANQGWSNYVRLRKASASAGGNPFSPGQLKTAVITQDRSVGKGNVAKGEALLQDLSKAASDVMPDSFGNPGTADAVGLGALGTLAVTNPVQGATAAAALTAAATPYMLMGRKIVSELPQNATRRDLTAAIRELDGLAASDPAVAVLRKELADRLSRSAGLSASSSQGQNARPPSSNPLLLGTP